MPGYRLNFMDAHGHIAHAREFLADDDLDAIHSAKEFTELAPMELWCRQRRVQRWEAPDPAHAGGMSVPVLVHP
jgi:hypothetical protein